MKKLLIILCMLLSIVGSSQIVYTNANNTVILSDYDLISQYTASYNIDMDTDGQIDFQFNIQKGSLTNMFKNLSITNYSGNNKIVSIVTGNPLSSNPCTDQMVDMEGNMVCADVDIPTPYIGWPYGISGYLTGTNIEWENLNLQNGDVSLYLGVRFQRIHPINGNLDTHYGYIHIGLGANHALVLYSYAWNPIPNACIIADDYNLANSGIVCTNIIDVYDTTYVAVYDTTNITNTVTIFDTLQYNLGTYLDTVQFTQTVYDTVPVNLGTYLDTIPFVYTTYDTVTTNLGTYLDTMVVTIVDTSWINMGTYLDTMVITTVDTILFNDTLITNVIDTIPLFTYTHIYDTIGCDSINPFDPLDPFPNNTSAKIIGDDFGLYPNPAKTVVHIMDYDPFANYYLIDIMGRKTELFYESIFVDHLLPGLYMVEMIDAEGGHRITKFKKH